MDSTHKQHLARLQRDLNKGKRMGLKSAQLLVGRARDCCAACVALDRAVISIDSDPGRLLPPTCTRRSGQCTALVALCIRRPDGRMEFDYREPRPMPVLDPEHQRQIDAGERVPVDFSNILRKP